MIIILKTFTLSTLCILFCGNLFLRPVTEILPTIGQKKNYVISCCQTQYPAYYCTTVVYSLWIVRKKGFISRYSNRTISWYPRLVISITLKCVQFIVGYQVLNVWIPKLICRGHKLL